MALTFPIGTLLNAKETFTAVKVHLGRVLAGDDFGYKKKGRTGEEGKDETADEGLLVAGQLVCHRAQTERAHHAEESGH